VFNFDLSEGKKDRVLTPFSLLSLSQVNSERATHLLNSQAVNLDVVDVRSFSPPVKEDKLMSGDAGHRTSATTLARQQYGLLPRPVVPADAARVVGGQDCQKYKCGAEPRGNFPLFLFWSGADVEGEGER